MKIVRFLVDAIVETQKIRAEQHLRFRSRGISFSSWN
jgi:hypothetical protein